MLQISFMLMQKQNVLPLDLLRTADPVSGLFALESDPETGAEWRWSQGPFTRFTIPPSPLESRLKFSFFSKIPGLKVAIHVDGVQIHSLELGAVPENISEVVPVLPSAGERVVSFSYSALNQNTENYPHDRRFLAVGFTCLRLVSMDYLETKICPHPFSQMDTPAVGPFVPCCYTWLTDEFYEIEPREYYASFHGKHEAWNGRGAKALRKAVLAGDYRFCRRDICQARLYTLQEMEEMRRKKEPIYPPISEVNAAAMAAGETDMPEGPAYASIIGDPRCNLACPSCRKEKITKLTPYAEGLLKQTDESLQRFAGSIEVMKMSADGEVFFSSYLRDLLKNAGDKKRFPRLREVDLITNGILFNQKTFDELRPGTELIRRVAVSVDSGTKEVYAGVRGGDWDRLWQNMQWVGGMRKSGNFKDFVLRFVVRKANFRTMAEFVRLAEEVGADCADFTQFVHWNGMAVAHFSEEAVHLPNHPDNAEFNAIRAELMATSKIRLGMNF